MNQILKRNSRIVFKRKKPVETIQSHFLTSSSLCADSFTRVCRTVSRARGSVTRKRRRQHVCTRLSNSWLGLSWAEQHHLFSFPSLFLLFFCCCLRPQSEFNELQQRAILFSFFFSLSSFQALDDVLMVFPYFIQLQQHTVHGTRRPSSDGTLSYWQLSLSLCRRE